MSERRTKRLLDSSKLKDILPIISGLTITLNISAQLNHYSYTESVRTNSAGGISGGGTRSSTYESYYFGFGIDNTSNISKRVQFEVHEVDADNYIVGKSYVWDDIAPGTRRRLWLERANPKSVDFKKWQIYKIGVANTPEGGKHAKVPAFDAESTPKISVYELFSLSKKPLEPKSTGCCGCLVTLVLGFFGLVFFGALVKHDFAIGIALDEFFKVLKIEFIGLLSKIEPMGKKLLDAVLGFI